MGLEGFDWQMKERERLSNMKPGRKYDDTQIHYMKNELISIDKKLKRFAKENPENTAFKFVYTLYKYKQI